MSGERRDLMAELKKSLPPHPMTADVPAEAETPQLRIANRANGAGHWLMFEDGKVVGCHCGFEADMDSDAGYGDSVVNHIATVVRAEAVAELRQVRDENERLRRQRDEAADRAERLMQPEFHPALAAAEAQVSRLRAAVERLVSCLEWTELNFHTAVSGKTVRDMAENIAANESALAAALSVGDTNPEADQ